MPGFKIKKQEGYEISTAEKETLEAITILGDPGADRILFWDESANTWKFLTIGSGLNITDETITASGGLINPMTKLGDMIYGDTAGAVARLAGNTTTTKKFLTSVGDGTNSTAPAYSLDFSTDGTFAGNSDTIVPSQKAIKTYVDGSVAGLLDYRGGYDASGNTYPTTGGSGPAGAVMKGDMWVISVAGTLGGEAVQIGDSIIANVDTPAQTASNWNHLNANISYVPENVANKKTTITDSDVDYPTCKAVNTGLSSKQNTLGFTPENVANKKTTITDSDIDYPTGKAVKTAVDAKAPLASPTFTGTVTLPKAVNIKDTSADHEYQLGVSELAANRTVTLPLLTGNDTFMFKDFHKASSAEINTGTEDNKYVTPDGLAGSNIGTRMIQVKVCDDATALTTGDGKIIFMIPEEMNGMNLVKAHAMVSTVSSSGTPTIQIRNVTDGVDMLSTKITIDASEYTSYTAATAPVIDTSKDDVATGDRIAIDVDSAGSGAKGLTIFLAFRLP